MNYIVLISIGGIIFLLTFAMPAFTRGAPYLPSNDKIVKQMITFAKIKPGMKAIDLGLGDGRIVIALARAGAEAHGYETNPFLVILSWFNIWRAGLIGKAYVHWGSFWHQNFSKWDMITMFQIDFVMDELEKKIKKELKPGAKIISNNWTFPNWKYSQKKSHMYI